MKLGQIWDYVMRRKAQFLMLAAAIFLAVAGVSRIITKSQANDSSKNLESLASETYNNSLVLKIAADGAKTPSYQLTFADNYTKAMVRITEAALQSEAYVRIFDQSGNLLRGEYTAIEDVEPVTPPTEETDNPAATTLPLEKPEEATVETDGETGDQAESNKPQTPTQAVTAVKYKFVDAPKNYEISLAPGSIIEVHSEAARFWSTLDNGEATAFRPNGTERYVVTKEGLSKKDWDEAKTLAENYQLLKRYLVQKIEDYQAKVSEEVLSDKNLDQAAKMKVVAAYNSLAEADQANYQEFVGWLINGKPPVEDKPGGDKPEQPGDETTKPGGDKPPAEAENPNNTPPIIIEEVPLPNDPATSVNNQYTVQTLGGRNDNEVVHNQSDVAQKVTVAEEPATAEPKPTTPQVIRNDNTASQNNTVTTETKDEGVEGMPLWQKIALVTLGIVVVLGLVRFIFDHYVR